jgi:hypothetical protein
VRERKTGGKEKRREEDVKEQEQKPTKKEVFEMEAWQYTFCAIALVVMATPMGKSCTRY